MFHQQVAHHHAKLLRVEAPLLFVHVLAVLDDGKDGGVGGRAADALLFQRLDERRFVIAGRRLREVLLRGELAELERLTRLDRGKRMLQLFVLRHFGLFILALLVDREETLELHDRPCGAEQIIAGGDVNGSLVEHGGGHLRGHKAPPDELVKLELIGAEKTAQRVGRALDRSRPDGLVSVLGIFLRPVTDWLAGQVVIAERLFDEGTHSGQRSFSDSHGVGSHVSN